MGKNIYEQRLEYAHRYFEFLNLYKNDSWIEKLSRIIEDEKMGIPEVLVLLHPQSYQEIGVSDPRGPSTFPSAQRNAKCRSSELWGYECPFEDTQIHVDHSFPRNRGGMTHAENAMYLCREHNLSKSTDIHLIPWEKIPDRKSWIEIELTALFLASQRSSTKKIYFPFNALGRL